MEQQKFDLIVIGAGPGGYPAAIKAAQLGLRVALIEGKELGGTCLNRGCIPSKTLISNAHLLKKIQHAHDFGITVSPPVVDYRKMAERKDAVVTKVRNSLTQLIASNGITLFRGYGKFLSPHEIKVNGQDSALLYGEKIIIATGSEPRSISAFPFDYKQIHDSTSLLELTSLPKSIAIIGGGVIGCEFASLFSAFGVKVSLFELLPTLIPMECESVGAALTKSFKSKGIGVYTDSVVTQIKNHTDHIAVHLADGSIHDDEIALVAVGRSLNTQQIGLDKAGVLLRENGMVEVNDKMQTTVPHIYAIGDIASKWWLAHVASHQGLVAARNAAGEEARMHYNAVPSVIFTEPEIGTVGLSLKEATEKGISASLGMFPFQALGKAQATMETEGFAQVVIDKSNGQILGAQVVGNDASTLVAEMAVAIANEMTLECITETIHAHPTVAEVWLEAALMANETPLHLPPKKRPKKSAS